jgi:hypothetical protein
VTRKSILILNLSSLSVSLKMVALTRRLETRAILSSALADGTSYLGSQYLSSFEANLNLPLPS